MIQVEISDPLKLIKYTDDIRHIISKYPECKERKDAFKALRKMNSEVYKLISKFNDLNDRNND